jgi:hypothetical protein
LGPFTTNRAGDTPSFEKTGFLLRPASVPGGFQLHYQQMRESRPDSDSEFQESLENSGFFCTVLTVIHA